MQDIAERIQEIQAVDDTKTQISYLVIWEYHGILMQRLAQKGLQG